MSATGFAIPWGAWMHERELQLALPGGWSVEQVRVATVEAETDLDRALDAPIGSQTLEDLARGRQTVAIAVEDITRPARTAKPLEAVVGRLEAVGIAPERVHVLLALGGHGPMHREEMVHKLGETILDRCQVWNHHPYENLVDLGRSKGGLPVHVNRHFLEADVRIAVGSVVPHPYAGFGGGGKIVLPGLAGIETLEMNHRPAVTGLSSGGLGVVEPNTARQEMEEIALKAGLQAVLNIVPDARRKTLGYFFGHPVKAHRRAVELAEKAYRAEVSTGADAAILNAYPKDTELLQVGNVFNAYRGCAEPPVRDGGTVVVTAACPHGVGSHSLHGPAMRLYREPIERPYLKGRHLIVYAPELSTHEVRRSFWHGYEHARNWADVQARLRERHPRGGRMLVFETAPLTLPVPVAAGSRA